MRWLVIHPTHGPATVRADSAVLAIAAYAEHYGCGFDWWMYSVRLLTTIPEVK